MRATRLQHVVAAAPAGEGTRCSKSVSTSVARRSPASSTASGP